MRIALVGATGMIGQRILNEALSRGHQVIAIARDPAKVPPRPNLEIRAGDVMKPETLIPAIATTDVLVSSCSPPRDDPRQAIESVRTLSEAVATAAKTGNHSLRLLMVGGQEALKLHPACRSSILRIFPKHRNRSLSPIEMRSPHSAKRRSIGPISVRQGSFSPARGLGNIARAPSNS